MIGVPRVVISRTTSTAFTEQSKITFDSTSGSLRSMRVVLTTHHAARAAIQGGLGELRFLPDPRPVYLVVVDGDFRRRPDQKSGTWLAIYVTPAFQARGHSGPASPGHPIPDRVINLDLNQLGRVYQIPP
ncbi:hypothetical protein GCM10023317_73570 [Actinopolymorpha pittospori]|uniref:Uncharacterized protein n=1 Tax=Actinopolymorpha pittospori TaxID=648752 RepID=A0A927MRT0_9ACTN|nr:hypothetical protein [Actinopolymorpha pittospori]